MTLQWPVDRSCLPELGSGEESSPEQDAAVSLAIQVMWALSGRMFGIYDTIARPCIEAFDYFRRPTSYAVTSYTLSWEGDHWLDLPCGCTGSMCRISGPGAVHLPGPALEIIEVKVGNTVLPTSGYSLANDVLFRIGSVWPRQDLSRPLGTPNTWSVEFLRGQPIPPGVDRLTGLLAREFLMACDGSSKCRLPRTVTSVSRQGISYQIYDPGSIYTAGKTGLAEIDLWLAAINPHHLLSPPSVI